MATSDTTIFLEHVRSFAEARTIPIRPLTLLVGENSSGKSTFLAAAACVFEKGTFPWHPGFNKPPFSLGTYETIATFKGGKYGRDDSFSLGFSVGEKGTKQYREVKASYQRDRGGPSLIRFQGKSIAGSANIEVANQQFSGSITLAATGKLLEQKFSVQDVSLPYDVISTSGSLFSLLLMLANPSQQTIVQDIDFVDRLINFVNSIESPYRGVVSLSPIRTKPKRTYDELSEEYSPEGDHIPKLLARIFTEEPQTQTAHRMKEALSSFGTASGLFNAIEVKKLGRGQDDPFQVQVALGGPKVNLVDVGYGVSQALPVIVQSVLRKDGNLMLIQQPEVHLHPRAQAALGTFFAELTGIGHTTLLVETHSDHLVDRVRQEVAAGKLKPEQVQILFFSKEKLVTSVEPLEIDPQGNVINAPEHYRQFFLEEELNLLR